jgi:hypothetical protein
VAIHFYLATISFRNHEQYDNETASNESHEGSTPHAARRHYNSRQRKWTERRVWPTS